MEKTAQFKFTKEENKIMKSSRFSPTVKNQNYWHEVNLDVVIKIIF